MVLPWFLWPQEKVKAFDSAEYSITLHEKYCLERLKPLERKLTSLL